ncbi:hypothetical protein PR048_025669 [Dryococelus australis]|uniref:Uncharacterized protein n=1 Tax=Dryococelus australis TaxID=614101 RepID=A0ABQ9GJ72_9NEOP|nr:hypothetical protein PR048_025669 [Dryococelus australis]
MVLELHAPTTPRGGAGWWWGRQQRHPLRNLHLTGTAVTEQLDCLPPTKANRVQSPAWSSGFRIRELCRKMPLFYGFSRDLRFPPTLHSGAAPFSPHLTHLGSQNLDFKSHQNLSTRNIGPELSKSSRTLHHRPSSSLMYLATPYFNRMPHFSQMIPHQLTPLQLRGVDVVFIVSSALVQSLLRILRCAEQKDYQKILAHTPKSSTPRFLSQGGGGGGRLSIIPLATGRRSGERVYLGRGRWVTPYSAAPGLRIASHAVVVWRPLISQRAGRGTGDSSLVGRRDARRDVKGPEFPDGALLSPSLDLGSLAGRPARRATQFRERPSPETPSPLYRNSTRRLTMSRPPANKTCSPRTQRRDPHPPLGPDLHWIITLLRAPSRSCFVKLRRQEDSRPSVAFVSVVRPSSGHIRGGVVGRLLASRLDELGTIPRQSHSRIVACGNRAGRCRWSVGFLGVIPIPPPLHSAAAPYSSHFTLTGSQYLDDKSRPILFTHSLKIIRGNVLLFSPRYPQHKSCTCRLLKESSVSATMIGRCGVCRASERRCPRKRHSAEDSRLSFKRIQRSESRKSLVIGTSLLASEWSLFGMPPDSKVKAIRVNSDFYLELEPHTCRQRGVVTRLHEASSTANAGAFPEYNIKRVARTVSKYTPTLKVFKLPNERPQWNAEMSSHEAFIQCGKERLLMRARVAEFCRVFKSLREKLLALTRPRSWTVLRMTVSLIASHQGEPGSTSGRVILGFSHVGIVPDDAAGRRIHALAFQLCSILIPPLSALSTSLLRAAQIS